MLYTLSDAISRRRDSSFRGAYALFLSAISLVSSSFRFFKDFSDGSFPSFSSRKYFTDSAWAFVSDYARFWILYNYGGLYFDTDVEVIKDMSDIIANGAFMGCEVADKCAPGLGLYKEILENYQQSHFLNSDGSNNYETVVDRTTNILKKYGFKESNTIQKIADVMVYPPEYFCPMDYRPKGLYMPAQSCH